MIWNKNFPKICLLVILTSVIVGAYFFKYKVQLSIQLFKNDNLIRNNTTVISVYFQFSSKHSKDEYGKWMNNFLNSVNCSLVIFTDKILKDYILNLRPDLKFNTIFYIYENVWSIMKELEIERNKSYQKIYINEQYDKDPEKNIHNPNLYAVWNIKAYITNKITEVNPFNSHFFIYTDIGAFRDEIIPNWPDKNFTQSLSIRLKDKILFGQIQEFIHDSNDFSDSFILKNLIEGGFFAGNKIAIKNFKNGFYKLHDQLLDRDIFVGKDQKIMNLYAFKTNKNEAVRLRTWNINCSKPYDQWFFYQRFLASDSLYKCFENKFSLLINF